MRLLECKNGKVILTKDLNRDIPQYAILSHTWGSDEEEVTYRDMVDGTGEDKAGYEKINFCVEQARRNGLQYFWIDTCCIDKSNHTELHEAINSMFRWYRNAARCYVYLADVLIPKSTTQSTKHSGPPPRTASPISQIIYPSNELWEPTFYTSRWFTRGWTLQELLAPASVEFFTRDNVRLGDKKSLEQQIHKITGIPRSALQANSLSGFSVEERFKWTERRETTREEDAVYCLLGIFGIFMSLRYGEGRTNEFARLRKKIAKRDEASGSQRGKKHVWAVLLERNPSFTSRKPELERLHQAVFTDRNTSRVAITGLGGVGKTQLALELVYQIKDKQEDCSIIWLPATSAESLAQAYLGAAKELGISGYEDGKADVKKLVQDYLSKESTGQWLLVFDNADDVNMWVNEAIPGSRRLIDYLPKSCNGSIIFTTRDRRVAVKLAGRDVVEISEMDEASAKQLLRNYLVDQDILDKEDEASILVTRLTHLPLAIVQAAMYINQNGISLREYLSLLEEQEETVIELLSEDFEDRGRYRDAKNPVATTWLISFEQIRHRDPLAADYLSFMSCVDTKDIPRSLLPPGQSQKREIDALGTLQGYSFIARYGEDSALNIHRLVHLATRNWLQKEGQLPNWTVKVVARLAHMLGDVGDYNRMEWRPYMPHASFLLGSRYINEEDKHRVQLLRGYALCLNYDGRYREAEAPLEKVTQIRKRGLGEEHPDTLASMSDLAWTYSNQGRWSEAELLGRQVMEARKGVLGEENPHTLTSMGNLAWTYSNRGRWNEAELLGRQVIEARKRILGEEHPHTLISVSDLASTYRRQGRWNEAELLGRQVMEARKRVLGEEHPRTLTSMSDLAWTYLEQGRWNETELLGRKVMEVRKRVLGEEHPHTLISISNIALTYSNQGRWNEAKVLGRQVIEARKRVLGEEHPRTLTSMSDLALTYRRQGRWNEAELLGNQVLEAQKRVLGEEHPDTLTSTSNLSFTWKSQGRHADALALMESCVHGRQRVLGPEHPYTRSSVATLKKWGSHDVYM